MPLEDNRLPFTFCTLAGVEKGSVNLTDNDEWIRGNWVPYPREIGEVGSGEDVLCEFANWQASPRRILAFTAKYGPLLLRTEGGKEFYFPVSEWTKRQSEFRAVWERRMAPAVPTLRELLFDVELPVEEGEYFEFTGRSVLYYVSTIDRLLMAQLCFEPREHLRKCKNPKCQQPYFISSDQKRLYCGDRCRAGADRASKVKWYQENRGVGSEYHRKKQRKRGRKG